MTTKIDLVNEAADWSEKAGNGVIATYLREYADLIKWRDELVELIKAHGSICGTCMCGAQFLPSGNGHCDNHAYTDMFDHYSRELIAKIEAEASCTPKT